VIIDAEVSSANGTAPIGFGGQVRRRASNTASRRFESSRSQSPRTGIQAIRMPDAGYKREKAKHIGAGAKAARVRSARLLTSAFANLILAAAEELSTAQ
jgi:hypothetical protein